MTFHLGESHDRSLAKIHLLNYLKHKNKEGKIKLYQKIQKDRSNPNYINYLLRFKS